MKASSLASVRLSIKDNLNLHRHISSLEKHPELSAQHQLAIIPYDNVMIIHQYRHHITIVFYLDSLYHHTTSTATPDSSSQALDQQKSHLNNTGAKDPSFLPCFHLISAEIPLLSPHAWRQRRITRLTLFLDVNQSFIFQTTLSTSTGLFFSFLFGVSYQRYPISLISLAPRASIFFFTVRGGNIYGGKIAHFVL